MASLLAKLRMNEDEKLAIVIDIKNDFDEVPFLSELEELLNKYDKDVRIVRIKDFDF